MSGPQPIAAAAVAVAADLELDEGGSPVDGVVFVDLDADASVGAITALAARCRARRTTIAVGVAHLQLRPQVAALVEALDLTLVTRPVESRAEIAVVDMASELNRLAVVCSTKPRAATSLITLLRQTEVLDVPSGLAAESAVYSTLLAGEEFTGWRAKHDRRVVLEPAEPPVLVRRVDDRLVVELNRPARHNAFGRAVRDGLIEALDLAAADPSLVRVELRGLGRSFCSGGDLEEFGSSLDVSTAHLVRLDRSAGGRIDEIRERVTAHLHGTCSGAGIELPAFASEVHAAPDTQIWLPEVGMGLVPGAGGTVSLPRRAGRWRTAYLALSGGRIDAVTAHSWGLVDVLDA